MKTFKIDIAIQSYKKPESLIYSLLSLHRQSKDFVDVVWINDDKSGDEILAIYKSEALAKALSPWKIEVRENIHRMGWWLSFVKGYKPSYLSYPYMWFRMAWNFYKNKSLFVDKQDIRYQWAIDNTKKDFLFLMHDDIKFQKNIVLEYYTSITKLVKPAIVGDLGQCWRCAYKKDGCTPAKIKSGYRPHSHWPYTKLSSSDHAWACRVNEWSALLSISAAKEIEYKHQLFFGNFDNHGDTSAFWFATAVNDGFSFDDPIDFNDRESFYNHGENGKSGHSVWVSQGEGRTTYNKGGIRKALEKEFQFQWLWEY